MIQLQCSAHGSTHAFDNFLKQRRRALFPTKPIELWRLRFDVMDRVLDVRMYYDDELFYELEAHGAR